MLVKDAWAKVRLVRGASRGGRLSHRKYAGSRSSTSDFDPTNQAARYYCTIVSSRSVRARLLWIAGGAGVDGGGISAKLSGRRGARRRDDTEVEARASFAHVLLCFNTLAIRGEEARHCDSSRTFSTHLHSPHVHVCGIGAAVILASALAALSHQVPSTAYSRFFHYHS